MIKNLQVSFIYSLKSTCNFGHLRLQNCFQLNCLPTRSVFNLVKLKSNCNFGHLHCRIVSLIHDLKPLFVSLTTRSVFNLVKLKFNCDYGNLQL